MPEVSSLGLGKTGERSLVTPLEALRGRQMSRTGGAPGIADQGPEDVVGRSIPPQSIRQVSYLTDRDGNLKVPRIRRKRSQSESYLDPTSPCPCS